MRRIHAFWFVLAGALLALSAPPPGALGAQETGAGTGDAGEEGGGSVLDSINVRAGFGIHLSELGGEIVGNIQLAPFVEAIGVGVTVQLSNVISFAPALDVSYMQSTVNTNGLVIPQKFENRLSIPANTVLLLLIDLPFNFDFTVVQGFRLGFGISPSILFRIGIQGNDAQTITDYYLSEGRFFVPDISLRIGYLFPAVELQLIVRGLVPIANLWDSDNSPFIHDLLVLTMFQLRFRLDT